MYFFPPFLQRWFKAIDSGWRAGLKAYRSMRTKQRTALEVAP
jgi:hypothetical protein